MTRTVHAFFISFGLYHESMNVTCLHFFHFFTEEHFCDNEKIQEMCCWGTSTEVCDISKFDLSKKNVCIIFVNWNLSIVS